MPKGVYPHTHLKPRVYPPEIIEAVRRMYTDEGKTVKEVQAELPAGFKAQRIIERYIPERRRAVIRFQSGDRNSSWKGDAVSYDGAHERVKALHGKASEHACVDCSAPAHDWSYVGGSPVERIDPENGCAYSPDISYYEPRCRSCHRQHDAAVRRNKEVMPYV